MHEKKKEQYLKLADRMAKWIKGKVEEASARGVILGLSGGADSAVATAIARRIIDRDHIITIGLPCESNPQDLVDAVDVARSIDVPFTHFNLTDDFKSLNLELRQHAGWVEPFKGLEFIDAKMAEANLKSRLRADVLYYYANAFNFLVLGTSNKSELMLGYLTKYGDSAVDIEPLGDLYKTEIWELARALGNIPDVVIERPPSAGLWKDQTDEEEIGFPYDRIDATLKFLERGDERPINDTTGIFERILGLMSSSAHKRKMPPIFMVDHKEFSEIGI